MKIMIIFNDSADNIERLITKRINKYAVQQGYFGIREYQEIFIKTSRKPSLSVLE